MDLLDRFLAQVGTLQQVWMPVVVLLAIIGIGIWRFAIHHYSGRIETLNDRLALKDDRIGEYERKLGGASPDEAKARMDALEARLRALEPRLLTDEQAAAMVPILSRFPTHHAQIWADGAAGDAATFSNGLEAAFHAAKWNTRGGMVIGIAGRPPSGLALRVADPDNLTPVEQCVAEALRAANVSFDIQKGGGLVDPEVTASLLITSPAGRALS